MKRISLAAAAILTILVSPPLYAQQKTLLHNASIIDGTGKQAWKGDILLEGDKIAKVSTHIREKDATLIDMSGKTIMPALISDHVHIGNVKGLESNGKFYTRSHILYQLEKYQQYGVENIMVMGTDRPYLFESGIRDSSANGLLPGARIHSATIGFGTPDGAPPLSMAMDQVFRPSSPDQIKQEMDSIMPYKPELVKLWIDDFNGMYKTKMAPAVYKTIIEEAHKRNLKVAAHVYYISDARQLMADGVNVIAHSIRDSVIDDNLLSTMKKNKVVYIPTLSLDEFAYIYARNPEWVNNPFFKASLEPGVYELITSAAYQEKIKNDPQFNTKMRAFTIALQNLKKVFDAGILVALGTDSGAMFLRAQGFSEHLELQLMTEAGLTPMQAIVAATGNAARAIGIDKQYGTVQEGKTADLLILNADPLTDIKNTRNIYQVWKAGVKVSNGPLHN